jgi:hypothetical protein
MNNKPLLSLSPHQFALSKPLSDDIEFIDALPRLDRALTTEESTELEMMRVLTALWQTDELRATPTTVTDETTNTLYFFERPIFDVVAWLHDDMRAALTEAYPGHTFRIGRCVRYGSWVGGDRGGNPNVTPDNDVANPAATQGEHSRALRSTTRRVLGCTSACRRNISSRASGFCVSQSRKIYSSTPVVTG